jgi:hypothetical protein
VDPDGRARVEWTARRVPPPAEPGQPPQEVLPGIQDVYELRGTVTPDGEVRDLDVARQPSSEGADLERRAQIEAQAAEFQALAPRLPAEPVGVGAVWEVTRTASMIGMRLRMTSTCVLVEADGDRLRIETKYSVTAPPQGLDLMQYLGLPPGESPAITVLSFTASGRQDYTLDLDHPLVAEARSTGGVDFSWVTPIKDVRTTFSVTGKMSEEGKRE